MSDMTTNATVNLQVNGEQARQQLASLRTQALQLQEGIAKAAAAGDKVELKKLRKQLTEVNRQIKNIESSSMQVEEVMKHLNSATPNELNRTLKTLQGQLEYIERGSGSWDEHVRKIQLVEREIDAVKKQIKSTGEVMEKTLSNVNGASIHDLETTLRMLQADFKRVPQGSPEWDKMKLKIDMVKTALDRTTQAAGVNGAAIKRALINLDSASVQELEVAMRNLEQRLKNMKRSDPAFGQTKRDLQQVKTALDEAKVAATQMHDVMKLKMKDVDKLTPRELSAAIQQLKERMQNVAPNTKEWEKMRSMMERLKVAAQTSDATITKTMRHLNTASPERLKTTLDMLNKQLNHMRVGSTAWDAQVKKINEVKAALDRAKVAAQTNGAEVQRVLRNMSAASPKELERTLQALTAQLENIKRGGKAWEEQVAKIKKVKAELSTLRAETSNQMSLWERFNKKLNDWQMSIMGFIGAATGLVFLTRQSINSFAGMEEEMANTRKYTRMTKEEVDELNESFKKMDTRLGRDKLNELAQEAGRLGKNTLESVEGYVEAAQIINVALVDLGEGATQTIAKISNIFGIEQMLGTKDAMLSVGSAVNTVSQNCTASKQYLVEFTQRMAGIGAQADLTVPQILAFGATLDANGQKVEMSASAVSRLIMKIYQDMEGTAKTLGLNVQEFTKTMEEDAYQGVMMLLQRVHELGSDKGMAALGPLFKDLGYDGIRMAQVLATLADHLDMVKWETGEATKAFEEATSATNEYEIFNNTVQAQMEKAQWAVHELSIELGEKLLPVYIRLVHTHSLTLRILNSLIQFVMDHRAAIISVTAAIVAYTVAINASNIAFKAHYAWLVLTQTAHKVGATLLATYKTAVLMCTAAYNKLTGNIERAAAAQRLMNSTLKASIYGLMAAAVAGLVVAIIQHNKELTTEQKLEKEMNSLRSTAAKKAQEEKVQIDLLRQAAMNEKLSLDERKKAIDKLNSIIPNYNAFLDKTSGKYRENKKALDDYIASLIRRYEIEGAKDKLAAIGKAKADLRIRLAQVQNERKEIVDKKEASAPQRANHPQVKAHGRSATDADVDFIYIEAGQAYDRAIAGKDAEILDLGAQFNEQDKLEKTILGVYGKDLQQEAVNAPVAEEPDTYDPNGGDYGGGGDSDSGSGKDDKGKEDRFAAEKAWREKEEALNRIAYATGQRNYEDYQQRMLDIAEEFFQKELEHTDLTENERLSIEADLYENRLKQREEIDKLQEEELEKLRAAENASYKEAVAAEMQRYVDGEINLEQYEAATEQLELEHLRKMTMLTKEGSEERLKAEETYRKRLFEDQKKRQKALEQYEKEYDEKLAKIHEDVFGLSEDERLTKYDAELVALQTVYAKELEACGNNAKEKLRIDKAYEEAKLALQIKYGFKSKRAMEKANEKLAKWLESDGGKAWTESFDAIVSQMGAIFSGLSDIIQSELEIQTSALEKKYDAEISAAEGNQYKVNKLEKEKQEETAKLKKEANKKLFAMQVIQAVAQTATSALNAYSSAAAIPVVGWVMAPIAASLALAAGAIQIAAIKKQQQASEAQGYSEGGFTPKGRKDEEVGVVHAGEWVASQELLANPEARAIINTLDYAQRTNTIGSLRAEDVSRSITAPLVLASQNAQMMEQTQQIASGTIKPVVVVDNQPQQSSAVPAQNTLDSLSATIEALNTRLNQPFFTVNSVTGNHGMKQAQDEYARLMQNKSPKRR